MPPSGNDAYFLSLIINPGTSTKIEVKVIAEDVTTTKTYAITINRAESLPKYTITLSAEPKTGGSLSGGGTFEEG